MGTTTKNIGIAERALGIASKSRLSATRSEDPIEAGAAAGSSSATPTQVVDIGEFKDSPFEETTGTFKGVKPYAIGLFETSDGPPDLFYRRYMPKGPIRAAFVLEHGTCEHSGRKGFVEMARRLAKQGYAVFAYDKRGHGKSEGYRVYVDDFHDYTEDLNAFMKVVRDQVPGAKVVLFGHSLGALVAANYAEGMDRVGQPQPDAVVLSSPPFTPLDLSFMERAMAKYTGDLAVADRNLVQNVINLKHLSSDPAVAEEYAADPLNEKFITPSFGKAFIEAQETALISVNNIRAPVLALTSPDDRVVPQLNTPSFVEDGVSSKDKRVVPFEGAGHEIFNELEPIKSAYYGNLISWLNKRFPAAS